MEKQVSSSWSDNLIGQFVIHSLVLVVCSLLFIFLMTDSFYQNWFGYIAISAIPTLVIINAVWQFRVPQPITRVGGQPLRGFCFALFAFVIGLGVAAASLVAIGHGITPPTPFLMMFIILSVVMVMWQLLVFEGWPFAGLGSRAQGWAMLAASYLLAYLCYWLFFDFSLLPGMPEEWLQIAPKGLFEPWYAIVFSITTLGVLFALQLLEFRPFSLLKASGGVWGRQPGYGLVLGVCVLAVSLALMISATGYFALDPVNFMVRGPVSFLFGLFLVLDTTANQAFSKVRQPLRGLLLILASMAVGALMCLLYEWFMHWRLSRISSGAPGYAAELWLANAMLSMTFPLILIYCHFLDRWPLGGTERNRIC